MRADGRSGCAIFDLGSARTKLLTAIGRNGAVEFRRYKDETGIAHGLDENLDISPMTEQHLFDALRRLRDIAIGDGCGVALAIATDVFRTSPNGASVRSRLERLIGPISILDPSTEGRIFFGGMKTVLSVGETVVVVDVGGGSVQVAWGSDDGEVVSLPLGTFRLERLFHPGRPPSIEDFAAMREHVDSTVRHALPRGVTATALVFGSNCMLEFVAAALNASACGSLVSYGNALGTSPNVLSALLRSIEGQPYDALVEYYPNNPIFMRGADKALIVVLSLAHSLGCEVIIPTDESVSTSLARIALSEFGDLIAYDLALTPLQAF